MFEKILAACRAISDVLQRGRKVLIMGNGGSVADA
jgi:phosphoheptose isomerase